MSLTWLKNLIGIKLTDAEIRDISHPYFEVHAHVTVKSIQAFGLLGMILVGPISALLSPESRTLAGVLSSATSCGTWGVIIGCILGPLLSILRLKTAKATYDAVYDRSYRLRLNHYQARVDRASVLGAVGGSAVAVALGGCAALGALLGMFAGIMSMVVYNNVLATKPKSSKIPKSK